jgi:hypothetical protein
MKMRFVITFYIFLVSEFYIKLIKSKDLMSSVQEIPKKLECDVCNEMFKYDFDYDKFLKDETVVETLSNQGNITKQQIEIAAKEVSMQYFFKGGESQFEASTNLPACKNAKIKEENCEILKMKLCESILSYQDNTCKFHLPNASFDFPKFRNEETNDRQKQYNKVSLLELSPHYVEENFDSVPKTHWKPPKPVLLQNFENNIGEQLKDISFLTT